MASAWISSKISTFRFLFGLLLIGFTVAIWFVHVIGLVYGKLKLHKRVDINEPREVSLPPISILKPLLGIEGNLFVNLETFFTLQYPAYELLFCVHEAADPALMVVKALINRYPNIDARIFTNEQAVGVNPKVNNLTPGYKAAKYGVILISDAGLRMKKDTLVDMLEAMNENVGIVTQMPFTCDRKGFAATLEKVWFGTRHARIYLSADFTGVICSTGMSSLIRKPAMDALGGIEAFGVYIAEDYFIAYQLKKSGWQCAIASQPAWQNSAVLSVRRFQDRICRWAKLRIAMLPQMILLEPVQDCMLLGLLCSWAVNAVFQWNSVVYFLIHVLLWMLSDYLMLNIVQNGVLPFGKFEFVVTWLYSELMAFPLFLRALLSTRVQWRGREKYRIRWGGRAEVVADGVINVKGQKA